MPPSPGKIHSLPVKVLYNIDSSAQSYLTVLDGRQDVYVHPPSLGYAADDDQTLLGSCYLKAVARGVCFASPECIPNPASLDFSVYNLDPSVRQHRPSRAFSTSTSTASPHPAPAEPSETSWTGKGFLSWALSEVDAGSTLTRGRLTREYEFAASAFNDQGGLEGLMAAASAGRGQRDDSDGKGWGLEVCVTLKQLNPEGKVEFTGRSEFEDMVVNGKGGSSTGTPVATAARTGVGASTAIGTTTSASASTTTSASNPTRPSPQTQSQNVPKIVAPPPRVNGSANSLSLPAPHQSSSASSTPTYHHPPAPPTRQSSYQSQLLPQAIQRPSSAASSRGSGPSLPSNSIPMVGSSSNQGGSGSRASSIDPRLSLSSVSTPTVSVHAPVNNPNSGTKAEPRQRETTPPPLSQNQTHTNVNTKTPPPNTPSRTLLRSLLRSEGKMSPEQAKQLANNPVLIRLFKAVPSSMTPLANFRLENANANANGNGSHGPATNGEMKDSPHSADTTTPTPSGSTTARSLQQQQPQQGVSAEGCSNCGTLVSSLWRMRVMKDGTKKRVCDACGLYFNTHKHMRPPELWSKPDDSDRRPKLEPEHQNQNPQTLHGPIRSSPRLHKSDHHSQPPNFQPQPHDSPRKRQRANPKAVPPSPRMATRASTKSESDPDKGSANGNGNVNEFVNPDFSFSPNAMFTTSPMRGESNGNGHGIGAESGTIGGTSNPDAGDGEAGGGDDVDLEALIAQIANSDTSGFNLEALFGGALAGMGGGEGDGSAGLDAGSGNGAAGNAGEMSHEMMELLKSWENDNAEGA